MRLKDFKLSDKAKRVVRTVAPSLGVALGGPLGGLAGQMIAQAIGSDDPRAIEDALAIQNPETMLALKKAEMDFEIQLEQLGVDREKIAAGDRISARDLAKTDNGPQIWISVCFLGGYFAVLIARMYGVLDISDRDRENLETLFAVLTAGVPLILMFWFGSSAGSSSKNQMLYRSTPTDPPAE